MKRASPRKTAPPTIDMATLRELAVEASCDPRTIATVAKGGDVRGLAGERARRVLVAKGYLKAANGATK